MTIQLVCLALILLLAILRLPRALRRPQARPAWWASIAGVVSLTTYGTPVSTAAYDHFLGGQNLLTLLRDLAAVAAFWFMREALAGYSRSAKRYAPPWILAITLAVITGLFLLIQHRSPTAATFVMNQIAQPASWLYGTAYMGTLVWILADSARLTWRVGRSVVRVITAGAVLTGLGCLFEILVLTAAHFGWGGSLFRSTLAETSAVPFFTGLTTMLLGIAGAAVLLPLKRRVLFGRLHRIGRRRHLASQPTLLPLAVLSPERQLVAQTHHLLVELGNAKHAGRFTPTDGESVVIRQVEALFRPTTDFRPITVGKAA